MINPLQPPINYMAMLPQVNLGQQFAELGQAFAQRNERVKAEEKSKQYSADLQAALSNPTQATFGAMIAKYPGQREAFKDAAKLYGEDRVEKEFWQGAEISNALESGNLPVARQQVETILQARKNSGLPGGIYQQMFDSIESGNTKGAQAAANFALSAADPDRFQKMIESRTKAETMPSTISEAASKATKAAAAAKFAESEAVLDLQKKGWDITKIQEDIKIAKENSRIAAINASIAREGNAIKRQEMGLKLDEMKQKRDEAVRTKAADVESARINMDNMLNTADRILNTPIGVVESAAGPISSRVPTLSENTADFEVLVDTLGSQSFLAQIPNIKGMGALSNAEGEKLQAALQNFTLKQSPTRLMENVREAQRLILKARKNVSERYGVPDIVPDTPAAAPSAGDIDALLKKYGAK